MNDFLSWCRHLLVPFLFLHPPSFQRNDFSTCSITKHVCGIKTKLMFTNSYLEERGFLLDSHSQAHEHT